MGKKISRGDVEYVANLAQLRLTAREIDTFTSQLDQIVSYMDKLDELDTSGIEPMFHALDMSNVFRSDRVEPSLPQVEALGISPEKEDGFFVVPKVIE